MVKKESSNSSMIHGFQTPMTRRQMLQRAGGGLGWLAFSAMLHRPGLLELKAATELNP
jgi:hypothetical protein